MKRSLPSGNGPLGRLFALLEQQAEVDLQLKDEIVSAYRIAERAHAGQFRKSGAPYISHPIAVAEIVAAFPPVATFRPAMLVIAALLHDVTDSGLPLRTLAADVDPDALAVVDAVTALERTGDRTTMQRSLSTRPGGLPPQQVAALAVVLKVADRLHNARTWEFVAEAKARRKAVETLDVIAPAAAAAGLTAARDELLALSHATLRRRRGSHSPGQPVAGTATDRAVHRLMHRAVDRLPAPLRTRYAEEWAADLAVLTGRRERWVFVLGLQYSARVLAAGPARSHRR